MRKRLVLLCGADPALLDRLARLVQLAATDYGSAVVHATHDADAARVLLETVRPDLVLLGVGEVAADGGTIRRMLRNTPALRSAPVLAYGPSDATPPTNVPLLAVPFEDDAAVAEMRRLLAAGLRPGSQ